MEQKQLNSGLVDNSCTYVHLRLENCPTTVLYSKASLPSLSDSRTPLNYISKRRFLINFLWASHTLIDASAQPVLTRLEVGLVNIFTEQKEGFLTKVVGLGSSLGPQSEDKRLRALTGGNGVQISSITSSLAHPLQLSALSGKPTRL